MGKSTRDRSPSYAKAERTRQEHDEPNYVDCNKAELQPSQYDAGYKSDKDLAWQIKPCYTC